MDPVLLLQLQWDKQNFCIHVSILRHKVKHHDVSLYDYHRTAVSWYYCYRGPHITYRIMSYPAIPTLTVDPRQHVYCCHSYKMMSAQKGQYKAALIQYS